jgi:hypothetical protein
MSDGTEATKLAQDLDAALAAYQRHYGRPATMARLQHMLARSEAAQRVTDQAKEMICNTVPRAAE